MIIHVRFIYLPMNLRKGGNLGYVFVDFGSVNAAERCRKHLECCNRWSKGSENVMEIAWSDTQGLDAHIQRYGSSPVMRECGRRTKASDIHRRCSRRHSR